MSIFQIVTCIRSNTTLKYILFTLKYTVQTKWPKLFIDELLKMSFKLPNIFPAKKNACQWYEDTCLSFLSLLSCLPREASTVAWQAKPPPVGQASIWVPIQVLAAPLPVQLPANSLGMWRRMDQVLGHCTTWEACKELLVSGSALLWPSGEWTSVWKISLSSLLLSLQLAFERKENLQK